MAQLPSWQSLEAGVAVPNGSGPGRIVALVASEGAVAQGWAGGAALELARSWSAAGEKVILVDGALHYPTLDQAAGVENVEGLSDAALFGLSVGRVAQPVDGGSFFLITAGTAVADANAVAGSPRWGTLLGGFLEAGVTLLLFVRDGDSGCAAFLGSASDIVVLSDRTEKAPAAVRDLEGMVRAVTGPGVGGVTSLSAGATAPVSEGLRPPEEWTAAGPGGRRRITVLAILAVLLILVLLVVFGILPIPGLSAQSVSATSYLPTGLGSVIG
ncbi:MAG: hypothetical protein PVJ80_04685 [Gemmatimonadota bacterium]|jgi:hypothetical protein